MMSEKIECVKWLDNAPKSIEFKFDGIEFEDAPYETVHNESDSKLVCGQGIFIDDSYTLVGKKTKYGYRLDIAFDSWPGSPLWCKGSITLKFDKSTGHWSMQAFDRGSEWKFCNPEAVLNNVKVGLTCYLVEEVNYFLYGVLQSLTLDHPFIVNTSPKYDGDPNDCLFYTTGRQGKNVYHKRFVY